MQPAATITKWNLDKDHSDIEFKVKHMMITNVTGEFHNYEAFIESDGEEFTTTRIQVNVDTASVDTGNEQRDQHIRSVDFFDVEHYPKMTFVSTKIERKQGAEDETYILHGNLTIRDVTQPVKFAVHYEGQAKDPWGNIRTGFTVTGKVPRKEFGLKWNVITDAGSMLVGEDVQVICNIQLIKAS